MGRTAPPVNEGARGSPLSIASLQRIHGATSAGADVEAVMTTDEAGKERLQKILARAGYGSRRACEELIVEGRVTINNQTVSVLGVRADPFRDTVAVDGERIHLPRPSYWIHHKLEGASFNDAESEEQLQSLISGEHGRLFTAGRLDRYARGLMLITNDGRLANLLTHPRYRVPKVYRLTVQGNIVAKTVHNIERALYYAMNSGRFEPIQMLRRVGGKSQLLLTVYEGLPQALRDICLKFDHGIKSVERVRLGPLELGNMKPGDVRKLRGDEISRLLGYADEAEAGRLHYENPLVDPARFKRGEDSGFRRKKTGTRGTKDVGQKKTSARVRTQGKGKPRSGDRRARDERDADRPRRDGDRPRGKPGGPRRDGDKPRSSGDRTKPGGRGKPSGPRREGDKPRGGRNKPGGRGKPQGRGGSQGRGRPSGGRPRRRD